MTKKALGRGLDELISGGMMTPVPIHPPRPASGSTTIADVTLAEPTTTHRTAPAQEVAVAGANTAPSAFAPAPIRYVALDQIQPNRFQPRTHFDADQLSELADSIRQQGIIQPLLVRVLSDTGRGSIPALLRYELIAGERRWRAAQQAGLTTIPVLVRQASDVEALEMALIENLQRDDLNPIEEARAYQQLTVQFALTQDQVAERVGRSRAAVTNAMRLLGLPDDVQSWVADQRLSVGHAKAILGLSLADEQRLVAERVLKRNLTVRETEQLVEQLKGIGKSSAVRAFGKNGKSPHILALEEQLRQKLGTHVVIHHGKKKGRLEIEYYGNDDLERLLSLFGVQETS